MLPSVSQIKPVPLPSATSDSGMAPGWMVTSNMLTTLKVLRSKTSMTAASLRPAARDVDQPWWEGGGPWDRRELVQLVGSAR